MKSRSILIICFLFICSINCFATTRYLPAPSYNSALQGLVNQSVSGDKIILRSGSHYITTPVVFVSTKNGVTVQGESGAVLRKAGTQAGIEIRGSSNTLTSINLDGGMLPEAGVIIYGQRNRIYNSWIHNCRGAGILLHNTGSPVCCLNGIQGTSVYYNDGVGISQYGHSDGFIKNCNIYENGREGITFDGGSHNNYMEWTTIHYNNKLNGGCGGIGIDASNGNTFVACTIDYTQYKSGITFNNQEGGCDGTEVFYCQMNYNAQWGILSEEGPYHTTNYSWAGSTFTGNGLSPNVYFR